MLVLRPAALVVAMLALGACGTQAPADDTGPDAQGAAVTDGVVRHEIVVIEHRSPGCPAVESGGDAAPDAAGAQAAAAPCAHARLEYPEFEGDEPLARTLREWTTARIVAPALFEGDRAPSADAVARDFVQAHGAFVAEFPDATAVGWNLERTVQVKRNVPPVVVLVSSEETYAGGAHPSYRVEHQAFHPGTGEALTLERILRPGAEAQVQALLEARFRENAGLAADAPLTDAGLFDDLPPADNLDWEPGGLTFHYNLYDVGPRSMGASRVWLSWDEMAPHLTADVVDLLDPWLSPFAS